MASCLLRLPVEKLELFLRQALHPLGRLLTLPPNEESKMPTPKLMKKGDGEGDEPHVQYQVDQNDPEEVEQHEQKRFLAWERQLNLYLPSVLALIDSLLVEGDFHFHFLLILLSACEESDAAASFDCLLSLAIPRASCLSAFVGDIFFPWHIASLPSTLF